MNRNERTQVNTDTVTTAAGMLKYSCEPHLYPIPASAPRTSRHPESCIGHGGTFQTQLLFGAQAVPVVQCFECLPMGKVGL